jgi:hypothetical protein
MHVNNLEQPFRVVHDLDHSHRLAWRYGMSRFGYAGGLPVPRGLMIGEAPGPNTDARLPLFPEPRNSAAGRLLRYTGVEPADWLGKLVRMNLCDGSWSARRATAGRAKAVAYLLDELNYYNGEPLRVLLLGRRVASAWACHGQFGYEEHQYGLNPCPTRGDVESDKVLHIAWIPHPSGKNLIYNDRRNQLRARRAVLWAIGERTTA